MQKNHWNFQYRSVTNIENVLYQFLKYAGPIITGAVSSGYRPSLLWLSPAGSDGGKQAGISQSIGQEAAAIFQTLAMGETVEETEELLVAPKCLQSKVLAMIDEEIAYAKNGGEGKTENIRVISIVGRLLEHSRIYIFGSGEREKIYIGSADYMTRNTIRRVEVAVPIHDGELRNQIKEMFIAMLSDNRQARELKSDGKYLRVTAGDTPFNFQKFFYHMAYRQNAQEEKI